MSEMDSVPKIVEARLRAAEGRVDHPDADTLTAFSERVLPERERSRILEHMARCSECREVLALAYPAEEAVVEVLRPVRGGWLTWPQLRWGLVAAGIVVVGSYGVLRYRAASHSAAVASYDARRTEGIAKEAKNEAESLPAAPEAASANPAMNEEKKAPVAGLLDQTVKSQRVPEATKQFNRLEQFSKLEAPSSRGVGGNELRSTAGFRTQALPHGPKPPTQWQQNNTANANSNSYAFQSQPAVPASPPPSVMTPPSRQVVVSSPAPAPASAAGATTGGPVRDEKQAQDFDTLAVQGQSTTMLPPSGAISGEVARAKPAEVAKSNAPKTDAADAYGLSTASDTNFSQSAALAPESARWSITAMGGLQRSLDQGKSWQSVDVNVAPAPAGSSNLQFAMKSSREKALAKDKADAKEAPEVFRAVSANGPDVWAGGSRGLLYHSTDAGAHWVRVVPSWSGVMLTEDILSLQFADPQRGRILTSSSEIWTTLDAGQTWQKH